MSKITGYGCETGVNIVLVDNFFSLLIMLGWFPYSDIWADVDLFVVNQNGHHEITEATSEHFTKPHYFYQGLQ